MSGTGFAKLRRTSAAADAARSIQQMIVDGRLAPGQRLPPERELSELLGISRPTLRETIRSLVGLNILESRHGAGTFVAALDTATLLEPMQFVMALNERTIGELFEARLLLEPALAALAAQRATPGQAAAMRAAITGADPVEADVPLHRLVAEASGNALLTAMLESLSTLGRSSRSITAARPGVRRRTAEDHEAIVAAVERRDPDAARAAMTAHLERIAAAARDGLA
ncbi:FadR family transcriptional regulator [Dactylosporangium aurantiacum]|uniref:FadR family transcriptional regulator n=1 Tax=Dactylosporangium aurantiacum TaxID=35754 RepID=A0A9Q9IF90_9ACTN|nr:FCD domain-containing protein [Dactylosporangium aurantiacum]MDG6103357.1 FCD domain-containing protein [Dactylosporangium aurantiacum]UWZ52123.1 FadR family transcriptional regulator [Dactylosporangium aurantiacum]